MAGTKKPETIFKEKVQAWLDEVTPFHEKIQQMTIRGTPDILACINGRFVAIELKNSESEKPDKLQEYKLLQIKKADGLSYVVYPENFEKMKKQILKDVATYTVSQQLLG